jgi:predicted anti-sigma-YlaC factor YlaD
MKCHEALDRLDDLVDAALPEEERLAVEAHLASCPGCRRQEQRLQEILAEARELRRERTPSRDLWPEIAREIGAGNLVSGEFARSKAPRWWMPALATAAAVLAVATTVAMLREGGMPFAVPGAETATAIPVSRGQVELLDAEQGYARAAAELLAALAERGDSLSPETRASVDRNLAMIDQALKEIRDALEKEPGNRDLTRMLASTHRKKVDVLRRVVKLSGASI